MMLDRLEGNQALKEEVGRMLAARRLSHSLLLVGEEGLGAGFAARCIAADYLYPAGEGNAAAPWPKPATAPAARWKRGSCGRPSRWKGWAAAGGIWWAR